MLTTDIELFVAFEPLIYVIYCFIPTTHLNTGDFLSTNRKLPQKIFIEPRLYPMISKTSLRTDYGSKSSIGLKAEVLLLLIITIFGIIGLTCCIGLSGNGELVSANLDHAQEKQTIIYDQQTET